MKTATDSTSNEFVSLNEILGFLYLGSTDLVDISPKCFKIEKLFSKEKESFLDDVCLIGVGPEAARILRAVHDDETVKTVADWITGKVVQQRKLTYGSGTWCIATPNDRYYDYVILMSKRAYNVNRTSGCVINK